MNKHLKKNFVRELKSPARYPILFIFKKRRETQIIYKLQETQQNHNQEQIPSTQHRGTSESINRGPIIHEIGPTKSVQPNSDKGKREMKDSLQNTI